MCKLVILKKIKNKTMKKELSLLIFIFLLVFSNCKNKTQVDNNVSTSTKTSVVDTQTVNKNLLTYKIQNKEKSETNNKAQLKIYAYLTTELTTKEELENTINKIYLENKNESGYKKFNNPTVIAIYLFTSENKAKEMSDQWIAMLSIGPNDVQPHISIDDLKFKSQSGLADNNKSKDEIELERLNKYLQKRGLELCALHKQLRDMELDCIHKADKQFPNFGTKHDDYSEKLMKTERNKLKKKYKLSDDIFINVSVFGTSYCK
jgi:hypothetical protein